MLKVLGYLILSLATINGFGQSSAYKVGEYESNGPGCLEYARITEFMHELASNPRSRGMIVVFAGPERQRIGNLLSYASGASNYIEDHGISKDRVLVKIGAGKAFFNEEFWIVPEKAEPPQISELEFDWRSLSRKYHFSSTCLKCEPSYPELSMSQPSYEDFVVVLRKNPHLTGLVAVGDAQELKHTVDTLERQLGLPRKRFKVRISSSSAQSMVSDLFLVPNRKSI